MKSILILSFIILSVSSCRKDAAQELKYLNEISAGETEGKGINYSGVINDSIFELSSIHESKFIDVNNDGENDFEIKTFNSTSASHTTVNSTITAIGDNYFTVSELDSNSVDTLMLNNTINNNLHWQNGIGILYFKSDVYLQPSSQGGLWKNSINKFIGIKINVDNEILFGWIRLETTNGWNIILKDYACTAGYF